VVLAEPGPRVVLIELVCGLLSAISITLLKEAYGPFTRTIKLVELIIVAFIPPVEELPAKFMPLQIDHRDFHFLSPAIRKNSPAV
jgi:hypothetical protein